MFLYCNYYIVNNYLFEDRFRYLYMLVKIKVHANSSKEEIRKIGEIYEVWVKEKPIQGKVNSKLLKMFKKYFKKPVRIKSGLTSRNKIIELG